MTKLKIAAAGLLAATTLATAGVVAVGAGRTDEPKPAMKAPAHRRRRRSWHRPRPAMQIPKPQAPAGSGPGIEGRIVDLEGRPVAGARIEVPRLWSPPSNGGLGGWLAGLATPPGSRLGRWLDEVRDTGVTDPSQDLSTRPGNLTATTGPDGRFRLAGVGPDQLAEIFVSGSDDRHGPALRHGPRRRRGPYDGAPRGGSPARSSTTPGGSSMPPRPASRSRAPSATRTPAGPSPASTLRGMVYDEHSLIPAPGIEATTDAQGHYRLAGLPRAPAYRLFVEPGEGTPYPKATLRAEGRHPGVRAGPLRHRAEAGRPGSAAR